MTRRRPDPDRSPAGAGLTPSGDPLTEVVAGTPGSPTRTERDGLYLAELRRGGPTPGWCAARCRAWGLDSGQMARELGAARTDLDERRQPTACQMIAHELTWQAHELTDEAHRVAHEPPDRPGDEELPVADRVALMEARAKTTERRVKALATVAQTRLRVAAGYLAIHRKPAGAVQVNLGASASGTSGLGAALKGQTTT